MYLKIIWRTTINFSQSSSYELPSYLAVHMTSQNLGIWNIVQFAILPPGAFRANQLIMFFLFLFSVLLVYQSAKSL